MNTAVANRVVGAALQGGRIPGIPLPHELKPEAADGEGSRLDFRLEAGGTRIWIEVKSTTFKVGREARFPDAVTARGLKHLGALMRLRAAGDRAVMLYLVARADVEAFRPAWEIDPAYAEGLAEAHAAGVEVIAVRSALTRLGVGVGPVLSYDLDHA